MIIDHPYIKSAKIVTGFDKISANTVNTLVLETTVELDKHNTQDEDRPNELLELLSQLKSFAEHDFADFSSIEVHCPRRTYFAHMIQPSGIMAEYVH